MECLFRVDFYLKPYLQCDCLKIKVIVSIFMNNYPTNTKEGIG